MPISEIICKIIPNRSGGLLSKFLLIQLDKAKPNKELKGMIRSSDPISASLIPNVALMSGILEAHVLKQIPFIKKKILTDTLCCVGEELKGNNAIAVKN